MQRIELIEPISSGRFATVYKARFQAMRNPVAIKILPKVRQDLTEQQNRSVLQAEVSYAKLLMTGECKNIVKSLDIFEDTQNLYNVLELCDSSLDNDIKHHLIDTYDYETILNILNDLVNAVDFVHGYNLIHCDMKPANILYDQKLKCFKLTDFGSTIHVGSYERPAFVTPTYCAPELNVSSGEVTQKIDIWAIGLIIYLLSHGSLPESRQGLVFREDLPEHMVSILKFILEKNPYSRPSIYQIKSKLPSLIFTTNNNYKTI